MRYWVLLVLFVFGFGAASWADESGNNGDARIFVVIHIDLKPPFVPQGTLLLKRYTEALYKELGVEKLYLLQQSDRPNHITLFEAWRSQEDYDRHIGSQGSAQLRTRLQPMLGSPFDERLHVAVK